MTALLTKQFTAFATIAFCRIVFIKDVMLCMYLVLCRKDQLTVVGGFVHLQQYHVTEISHVDLMDLEHNDFAKDSQCVTELCSALTLW